MCFHVGCGNRLFRYLVFLPRVLSGLNEVHNNPLKGLSLIRIIYSIFCEALGLDPRLEDTFILFSLVGGIPKYWEWIEPGETPIEAADRLYFGFSSQFEKEPQNLLASENIHGLIPTSILEAVGRGSHRPSEIAARLQLPQQNLSKVFPVLMETQLLHRETPYGDSERNSKKTLYKIQDPVCRFWYQVYSPHRTLWYQYTRDQKLHLIRLHASSIFEDTWRSYYPDSKRYWEKNHEFDGIRKSGEQVILSEVKFTSLSVRERAQILEKLKEKWASSAASKKFSVAGFEVIDWTSFLDLLDRSL